MSDILRLKGKALQSLEHFPLDSGRGETPRPISQTKGDGRKGKHYDPDPGWYPVVPDRNRRKAKKPATGRPNRGRGSQSPISLAQAIRKQSAPALTLRERRAAGLPLSRSDKRLIARLEQPQAPAPAPVNPCQLDREREIRDRNRRAELRAARLQGSVCRAYLWHDQAILIARRGEPFSLTWITPGGRQTLIWAQALPWYPGRETQTDSRSVADIVRAISALFGEPAVREQKLADPVS